MNEWIWEIVGLSLIATGIRELLPQGEKSALYPPIKFLLSLIMILVVSSPLTFLFRWEKLPELTLPDNIFSSEEEDTAPSQNLLVQRSVETMAQEAKNVFPHVEFSLSVYTDREGQIDRIAVSCQSESKAQEIACFLAEKYALEGKIYVGEESK